MRKGLPHRPRLRAASPAPNNAEHARAAGAAGGEQRAMRWPRWWNVACRSSPRPTTTGPPGSARRGRRARHAGRWLAEGRLQTTSAPSCATTNSVSTANDDGGCSTWPTPEPTRSPHSCRADPAINWPTAAGAEGQPVLHGARPRTQRRWRHHRRRRASPASANRCAAGAVQRAASSQGGSRYFSAAQAVHA